MATRELKHMAVAEVERHRPRLVELSQRIHSHPELGFQEFKAAEWVAEYLEREGFRVERGLCGMPTALRARYGSVEPAIALIAEYDALPELGHGCGHNIIAAAAVGAAVASKRAVDELGGTVVVLGTPAEELYGGKAIMVEQGAFAGLNAALMVHPGRRNAATAQTLACVSLDVEFFGREAHAAANPEQGINALEAMLLSFNAINSLRQHIRGKARVHGIITDGGKAANVVPRHSAGTFLVRADDQGYLEELKAKVLHCFTAAALATGARLEHRWGERVFACLRSNQVLAGLFAVNLESLGRKVEPLDLSWGVGSTDMGNVSQVVPAIHPSIAIAPLEVTLHSPEFARAAASEQGELGLLDSAKALAMTVVDLLDQPGLLERVRAEFSNAGAAPLTSSETRCCGQG
ncbi:MAG: M20 family metallopeptidase [Chloroflexota bacterium]